MSTTAPKPPSKLLLVAAGVTGGMSLCMFGMIWVGHVMYDNIPTGRLVTYTLIMVAGVLTTAALATFYLVQKWRRDAWWDGHTACDDPDADTMPLRRVQAELAGLAETVHSLADAAGRPRPQPQTEPAGNTYTSRAAQDDTVMMVTGGTQHAQVQVAEREPTDPIAEARVEGYVEGYADGITRRDEGTE